MVRSNSVIHVSIAAKEEAQLTGILVKRFGLPAFKHYSKWRQHFCCSANRVRESLCSTFPAVYAGKMTVVLTPTISLMQDQSASLQVKGIHSTFLGSSQKDATIQKAVACGKTEVVLVTPEKFYDITGQPQPLFAKLLREGKIGLLEIDEAHLDFEWQSFRYGIIVYKLLFHLEHTPI